MSPTISFFFCWCYLSFTLEVLKPSFIVNSETRTSEFTSETRALWNKRECVEPNNNLFIKQKAICFYK